MKDILNLVQITLDELFTDTGIRVFWGRRADIDFDANAPEYVIYSIVDDAAAVSANADLLYRVATIALQYYVKFATARTYTGRQLTTERMEAITKAMRNAGFYCPNGWAEIGDVDNAGFATFRAEFDKEHFTGADDGEGD